MANFTKKSSSIILPPPVERKVNEIADAFFNLTRKKIVITDGTRTAAQQAVQVYNKILSNDLTIYLNQRAANEIKVAFDLARSQGKSREDTLRAMTAVIEAQIERGVFISRHLTGKAFDVRNKDMTKRHQTIFKQVAQTVGGVTVLPEGRPPTFTYSSSERRYPAPPLLRKAHVCIANIDLTCTGVTRLPQLDGSEEAQTWVFPKAVQSEDQILTVPEPIFV